MRALLLALVLVCETALAAGALVSDLQQRLRAGDVESVNAFLSKQPVAAKELAQRSSDCDPDAVSLAVKLSEGKNSKLTELHRESLRIAVGTCTEFVLDLLPLKEIPKVCASASTWSVGETARELKRRMHAIEADETLRSSARGKACNAAYLFELKNTRVGVQVGQPASKP